MTKLNQLLTIEEQNQIRHNPYLHYLNPLDYQTIEDWKKDKERGALTQILSIEIKDLTVQHLSALSIMLIYSENTSDKMPECVLSAKAIEILINRAQKLNLPIF